MPTFYEGLFNSTTTFYERVFRVTRKDTLGHYGDSQLYSLRTLRLSALAPLGLARYKTRAPLARRLRASALKNELPFLGLNVRLFNSCLIFPFRLSTVVPIIQPKWAHLLIFSPMHD